MRHSPKRGKVPKTEVVHAVVSGVPPPPPAPPSPGVLPQQRQVQLQQEVSIVVVEGDPSQFDVDHF